MPSPQAQFLDQRLSHKGGGREPQDDSLAWLLKRLTYQLEVSRGRQDTFTTREPSGSRKLRRTGSASSIPLHEAS